MNRSPAATRTSCTSVNPYQTPASIHPPSAADSTQREFGPADSDGIPHEGFLQYRRAAACQCATMAVYFLLACVSMVRDAMIVDAAIGVTIPLTILVVIIQVLQKRTAGELKLSLQRYRSVSLRSRLVSLWLGPFLFAVGIAQLVFVPESWQVFPYSFFFCGPATLGCAFLWPRVEKTT